MITVGQLLKDARKHKNITLKNLEDITKIKKAFIEKLENNDWDNLPDYPVISGFVKNLSTALDISPQTSSAILRRDYLPKKLYVNPKPDVVSKFSWSPKLTFSFGVGLLVLIIFGYLVFQYRQFISSPDLFISSPKNNEIVLQSKVKVLGKTSTDAVLLVNNQPITLDQDGNFETEMVITKETKELKFTSTSRSGKVTEKIISISVE